MLLNGVSIVNQTLIDVLMVLFSLIFNVIIVIMFIYGVKSVHTKRIS
jgi:hypothetical protein